MLGAACCARLATLLRCVATCSNLKVVRFFMQHLWMLHDVVVVWSGSCNNVAPGHAYYFNFQYATRSSRPNASNMLRPTVLRYVALKCCHRLAGACKCWTNNFGTCSDMFVWPGFNAVDANQFLFDTQLNTALNEIYMNSGANIKCEDHFISLLAISHPQRTQRLTTKSTVIYKIGNDYFIKYMSQSKCLLKGAQSLYCELFQSRIKLSLNLRKPENNSLIR